MENKDSIDYILYYNIPVVKCADIPKDGKANRRERRKQERRRKKGRL